MTQINLKMTMAKPNWHCWISSAPSTWSHCDRVCRRIYTNGISSMYTDHTSSHTRLGVSPQGLTVAATGTRPLPGGHFGSKRYLDKPGWHSVIAPPASIFTDRHPPTRIKRCIRGPGITCACDRRENEKSLNLTTWHSFGCFWLHRKWPFSMS